MLHCATSSRRTVSGQPVGATVTASALPKRPATYTAVSYGDAARALGEAITAQYLARSSPTMAAEHRRAASRFGDALASLGEALD